MNNYNTNSNACMLVVRNSGRKFYRMELSTKGSSAVNLDELADRIIKLESVEEVDVRAKNPGGKVFLETRFRDGMEPRNASAFISRHIRAKF